MSDFEKILREKRKAFEEKTAKKKEREERERKEREEVMRQGVSMLRETVLPELERAQTALRKEGLELLILEEFDVGHVIPPKPRVSATVGSPARDDGYRMESKRLVAIFDSGKVDLGISDSYVKNRIEKSVPYDNLADTIGEILGELTGEVYEAYLNRPWG